MAMNRMRSAFAPPRKGETFELRAGLVYVFDVPHKFLMADRMKLDHNMPTSGKESDARVRAAS